MLRPGWRRSGETHPALAVWVLQQGCGSRRRALPVTPIGTVRLVPITVSCGLLWGLVPLVLDGGYRYYALRIDPFIIVY